MQLPQEMRNDQRTLVHLEVERSRSAERQRVGDMGTVQSGREEAGNSCHKVCEDQEKKNSQREEAEEGVVRE